MIMRKEDFQYRFKALLSDRDKENLELRAEGVTYEEVAMRLGYKNHIFTNKTIFTFGSPAN